MDHESCLDSTFVFFEYIYIRVGIEVSHVNTSSGNDLLQHLQPNGIS